ncbi:bifunctional methyltransferase/pyrophosphohydrolase YabN [Dethiobacter alkaliphilus]|uniref:MazG family protein n=1 Tax=Dethiobacter alkaliphilus AHT 1 TaxID=555088 RepID=C0GIZ4_DETAL|nr:nucleoside triphosphate pyrophosphohydrolase [Dethiobacter alkaliphilus]EEG76627.1 MazG family protein [Dethiobacter alkaliphilus AHT 1]
MKRIYLVGLGPGDPQALTLRSLQTLEKVKKVYIRTHRHPGVSMLDRHNIDYKSLDFFYKKSATFEETYRKIAFFVINAALQHGEVAYAVPGSPFFAEKTVELILKKSALAGISCRALPAVSFVEAVSAELGLPREKELVVHDALEPDKLLDNPDKHLLIIQAYNRQIASRVKLQLATLYPEEHRVTVVRGAGLAAQKMMVTVPLYELDRLSFIDHLTTIYVPPIASYGIADLQQVMRTLRSEDGCPWDREQDHHSLKPYLLEEAYEVIGAIDSGDNDDLCEELGDLLLQVVFHCQIANENQAFAFHDIVAGITEKLVRRHPHVFGQGDAKTADEVVRTWQQIKKDEKKDRKSLFTLENYLPSLLRAQKLQRQASGVGFDWPDAQGAWDKLAEELKELKDAYKEQDGAKIKEEMGDLLFAAVNVARFLDVDAEQALAAATNKFFTRLRHVENRARDEGGEIAEYSLSKLDEWWNEAKKRLNG